MTESESDGFDLSLLRKVMKNKRKLITNTGNHAGTCYVTTLVNQACSSTEYASEILRANGIDILNTKLKSVNQLNTRNMVLGAMIIEQHISTTNCNDKVANYLCRLFIKWSLRLGPKKALSTITNIIQRPKGGSNSVMRSLRDLEKRYEASIVAVDHSEFVFKEVQCWDHALFGSCKKCNRSHFCPECGEDHSLEYCTKLNAKTKIRLSKSNQRWRNGSHFKHGKHGNKYNNFNGKYKKFNNNNNTNGNNTNND